MKPVDHERLTRIAVDLFDFYSPHGLKSDSVLFRQKIVDGAVAEDNPSPDRLRNWHFFRENNHITDISAGPLVIMRRTSEKILDKRVKELETALKKQGANSEAPFLILGRVLHHIQDMSAPAHATPVYHDPLTPDSFEDYSARELAGEKACERFSAPSAGYQAVMDEPVAANPMEIYEKSARATLKFLCTGNPLFTINGNPQPGQHLWSYFWVTYDHAAKPLGNRSAPPGFGHYGPLGKHFGMTDISIGKDQYAVDRSAYSEFHAQVVGKIIRDSLRVLRWFEGKIV
jgi:hypothetical protein